MSSEPSGDGEGPRDEAPRRPSAGGDDADAAATAIDDTSLAATAATSTLPPPVLSTQRPDAVRFADFRCPICLDLLYKPCAPAAEHCSHAFCFWCLHSSMSPLAESRCPLDRGGFSHQPAVAVVLHRALGRLFPSEYRRRARETREEEMASRTRSQAVDDEEEQFEEGGGGGGGGGGGDEKEKGGGGKLPRSSSSSSSPPATPRAASAAPRSPPLSPEDFTCSRPGCGRLLLNPVVLNCGHAVCGPFSSSSPSPSSSSCVPSGRNCLACGGAGRVGGSLPRTCALLAGLVEALFPAEVAQRREAAEAESERRARERGASAAEAAGGGGAGGEAGRGDPAPAAPPPAGPPRRPSSLDTHFGIGCDACGAYPLKGRRFRCLDCAEATAVGFDLCGDCYDDQQRQQRGQEERGEDAARVVDGRFAQVGFFRPFTGGWGGWREKLGGEKR